MSDKRVQPEQSGSNRRVGDLPPVRIDRQQRPDGSMVLKYSDPLQAFDPLILHHFAIQARRNPHKTLFAQRRREADGSSGDWERIDFATGLRQARGIGQWLLDQGLGTGDTVLLVSGNSIAHALLRIGCLAAGVAACPVSASYALMVGGYERLKHVLELVKPRALFAEDSVRCRPALEAIDLSGRIVITRDPAQLGLPAFAFDALRHHVAGDELERRIETTDPDNHAVYMLTSGSTGMPKVVIQTQRMLSTNLHQVHQLLGEIAGWRDLMLDWLPWSHVSGAFNLLAAPVFGGSLYIDDGKPLPGLFAETIRNLKEISVPCLCNVPAGFALLADALEQDASLRHTFFSKLRMLLYGGAGLSQALLDRLQKMAIVETGQRVFITSGYGATETASGCMGIYFDTDKVGIGLPMPGLEVKLVPRGDRYEIRLRGDNVMPGYLHNPAATAAAFDEEGFYITGDAARLHDQDRVEKGLYFAGRLAEEFKLGTGTWVYAGQVRARIMEALLPAISDVLLCGIGRDSLAVLGVPSLQGLREITGNSPGGLAELQAAPAVRHFIRDALEAYNAAYPASSMAIHRFAFMREAPSAARHEISDKGTLNQLLAAANREQEIAELYADPPGDCVIVI